MSCFCQRIIQVFSRLFGGSVEVCLDNGAVFRDAVAL
jgi:hypothetical protein